MGFLKSRSKPSQFAHDRPSFALLGPALIILAAVAISYGGLALFRLGFYVDDWPELAAAVGAGGGFWHLLATQFHSGTAIYRPLDVLSWTAAYSLFGMKAWCWQACSAALTAVLCLLFYSLLTDFGAPPQNAVLAALIFLGFPNKDATLFWPGASLELSLALSLFLASFIAHLRYLRSGRPIFVGLSAALLLFALSTYEQCFFLLPLWILAPAARESRGRLKRSLALCGAVWLLFGLAKFVVLPHFIAYNKAMSHSLSHAFFVYYMALRSILDPRLWAYLGRCALAAVRWHPGLSIAALGLPWLAYRALKPESQTDAAATGRRLLFWGGAFYALGYLPLCFSDYAPVAYDHMNRLNQLPAIGLSAALCGWSLLSPSRQRSTVLVCLAGLCLILNLAFSSIWRESYRREMALRQQVATVLDRWPSEKLLLVQLPELYAARKAPVFTADYELGSAIRLWTHQPDRVAAPYCEWVSFSPTGATVFGRFWPYGSIMLLDAQTGRLSLLDARSARSLPPVVQPWETALKLWPDDRG